MLVVVTRGASLLLHGTLYTVGLLAGAALGLKLFSLMRWYHIAAVMLFLAGAALSAFAGVFVAMPVLLDLGLERSGWACLPALVGCAIWIAWLASLFLRDESASYQAE